MNGNKPIRTKEDNSLSVILDDNDISGAQLGHKHSENCMEGTHQATEAPAIAKRHQVLPEPSPEQKDIIQAVGEDRCVTIRACAGSGKTTCMLQVAASLPEWRQALIITYNRSLADECKERIQRLSLGHRVWCYTIHGLASRFASRVCNDDHKLMKQLDRWNKGLDRTPTRPMQLDLVMIDEAQDLRPLFHRTLSHIFDIAGGNGIQLCLVGDPKQMLYDFPTYGDDRASTSFFLQPEKYWGEFTQKRSWSHLPLSVSYRLTPNIASFCNLFWGTSMVGGNVVSPNVPVEYLIKYPYPTTRGQDDPEKLNTSFLANIIDQYGPENVLFLAQSVKNADLPIRVHVNELMKIKDNTTGFQKYNFHIKENVRGFEGTPDWKNKVRVWTFCGSKGCESDVVVVFGLDIYGRPHALNQVGVALSRARKRLLVVHSKKYVAKKPVAMPYYPVLGDCPSGMKEHIVRFGRDNCEETTMEVPAIETISGSGGQTYTRRCELTKEALATLAKSGVIRLDNGPSCSNSIMPNVTGVDQKEIKQVYVATEFNYFSASAETRFLGYGTWSKYGVGDEKATKNCQAVEADTFQEDRINYETNVQFATTTEDVSALYGEAVVYMLQWELCNFVPNIETVVSDGMLRLHPDVKYSEEEIRQSLRNMFCEDLTRRDDETLKGEFGGKTNRIKGKDLIPFLNNRMSIKKKKKKRGSVAQGGSPNDAVFPVKAIERKSTDDDNHLAEFLPKIKSLYESETSEKKPYHWIYLANAVMAFSNYHEKFRQIGTDPNSYESWVDSKALICGLERLQNLMKVISPTSKSRDLDNIEEDKDTMTLKDTCSFEKELSFDFGKKDYITEKNDGRTVVGVVGVCDWINKNRLQRVKMKEESFFHDVDLLEIKFVHHLSNIHRLQVLVYTALYALKVNNVKMNKVDSNDDDHNKEFCFSVNGWREKYGDEDNSNGENDEHEWKIECCRGMLYNARTGETEICTIQAREAMGFLLDISQFKYNGKNRENLGQGKKSNISKKQIKRENSYSAPKNGSVSASSHRRRVPKKRLETNTGKSYYAPLSVEEDDENIIFIPRSKRPKKSQQPIAGEGTDNDPIVLD